MATMTVDDRLLDQLIGRCDRNLGLHGRRLDVSIAKPCDQEKLEYAECALGLPFGESFKRFLLRHNGMELDSYLRGPVSDEYHDHLKVLSADEVVEQSKYINGTVDRMSSDRKIRYVACGEILYSDVLLRHVRDGQAVISDSPVVISRPGDIGADFHKLEVAASSFDDWLNRALISMATTSFGFDYEAQVSYW